MIRVTIEVVPTDAVYEYAETAKMKGGTIEVYDDKVVVNGTAQHIRNVINFLAKIKLLGSADSDKSVFVVHDPNGERHQIMSKNFVYSYCVVFRNDYEAELKELVEETYSEDACRKQYARLLRELDDPKWAETARECLEGINSFEDYFAREQKDTIEPVRVMVEDGAHLKYRSNTSSWCVSEVEAKNLAERYTLYGYVDVTILNSVEEKPYG
jgi:hypothetical protein